MPLPLRTAAFWTVYRLLDRAPVMQQPADKVRAKSELRKRLFRLPASSLITGRPDRSVTIADTALQLDDGTELPLRIYRPRGQGSESPPVVVNFHGGGWVSGDVRQSEWWCAGVAAGAGAVVVSVEYRLAPEHPFPTPVEDCYAATKWVAEHGTELGADGSRLAVMGDSAGGNLAAVVCLLAREGGPAIDAQVLLYPVVDLTLAAPSTTAFERGPLLTRADMDVFRTNYLGEDGDASDPFCSPLLAPDHSDLPPALVITAQVDPLHDDGVAYAERLRHAGVPTRHSDHARAVHGFICFPGMCRAAGEALDEICHELSTRLA